MSVQHREDSIRNMRLERLGIQPPADWNDVEQVRAVKKQEIGAECSAAIYAGIDVNGSHYSLTEHDQTELLAQAQVVKRARRRSRTTPTANFAECTRRRNSPAGAGRDRTRFLPSDILQPRERVD